ncbi:MAG: hypothetical protein GXX96_08305 [Planctomycetaceae bacterium]|nr:hypothetical protein [Planctomycetaceae bacterium]
MSGTTTRLRPLRAFLVGLVIAAAAAATTGCQVDLGGQTLPSPWYTTDDVQYFPPGPEFKLQREATALKKAQEEAGTRQL